MNTQHGVTLQQKESAKWRFASPNGTQGDLREQHKEDSDQSTRINISTPTQSVVNIQVMEFNI